MEERARPGAAPPLPRDGSAGFQAAQEREVTEADPAVRAEEAVVGVWVAADGAFAPDETEEEAEHDLADAVALGLVELRDLDKSQPVDVLRDEHASGREIGVHERQPNVRVVPKTIAQR